MKQSFAIRTLTIYDGMLFIADAAARRTRTAVPRMRYVSRLTTAVALASVFPAMASEETQESHRSFPWFGGRLLCHRTAAVTGRPP